jgi:hypothetical protein
MALDTHRLTAVDGAGVRIEVARIFVIGDERLVFVIPHDLQRDLRIVGIDVREGQAGDVVPQPEPVRLQAHLRGIFLGRLEVRFGKRDLFGSDHVDGHAVPHTPFDARGNHVARLVDVLRVNDVTGFHRCTCGGCAQQQTQKH